MVKLYFKFLKQNLKSELEYKASFIFNFIGNLFIFATYYFTIIALFGKFDNMAGFNIYEVLVAFGIIHFGYSFNEIFFRGLDVFENFILKGDLDRLFLRPQNVLFQVMCSQTDIVKISRLLQSLIILVIALINLKVKLTFGRIITLLLMILSAIIMFFSLFLLAASFCFKSVQALEVKNLITDGMKFICQYPVKVLRKGFVLFLTFIVPFAFVNYYPLLYVIGRTNNLLYAFSPLLTIIFVVPSIIIFNIGLKHYSSVGS